MKVNVLQPTVVNKFSCIGGACKATCCKGWKIDVKRHEFKKIKKSIHSPELQELFSTAFITEDGRDFRKSEKYFMHLDGNKLCPFLTEEHLCGLQLDGGIDALPATCIHFPRIRMENPMGFVEQYLDLGCEEVINSLIREEDGLMIEEKQLEIDHNLIGKLNYKMVNRKILDAYFDIQVLYLSILQNRMYTIPERMILLGIAMDKINTMEKEKREGEVPFFVERFIASISDEEHPISFEEFVKDDSKKAFIGSCVNLPYGGLTDAQNTLKERLGLKKEINTETNKFTVTFNLAEYLTAMEGLWKWLEGKEHYMENVLVMLTFMRRFPFNLNLDIWGNYTDFAIIYTLYLFYLSGYIKEDSTDEDFTYCTVELARAMFKINADLVKNTQEFLKKEFDTSLVGILGLIV